MAVPKLVLTDFGIQYRLESSKIVLVRLQEKVAQKCVMAFCLIFSYEQNPAQALKILS